MASAQSLFADEINISCDANGKMTALETPLDKERENYQARISANYYKCSQDLRNLTVLAQNDLSITAYLANKPASLILPIPVVNKTLSCQEKAKKLTPKDFVVDDSKGTKRVKLYYPYNSPYAYVMGYQPQVGSKNIALPAYQHIAQIIESAVSLGIDPYMALSLAQMENPFAYNLLNQHVHDQTAAKILGCDTSESAKNKNQMKIWAGTPESLKQLVSIANSYESQSKQIPVSEGQSSYLCVGKLGSDAAFYDFRGLRISQEPDKTKYCCTRLPIALNSTPDLLPSRYNQNVTTTLMSNAILYKFLGQLQKPDVPTVQMQTCANYRSNINFPEFRIQSFLGFSKSTGSGMSNNIASWRLGVDSCVSPTYGLQAMDFMINSLMPNPLIRKLVSEAEANFGEVSRHHICLGRENQSFSISEDYYFNMHKDAERFSVIRSKLGEGTSFLDVKPLSFQQPLANEILKLKDKLGIKDPDVLAILKFQSMRSEYMDNDQILYEKGLKSIKEALEKRPELNTLINDTVKNYFDSSVYAERKTVGLASKSHNPDMTWEKFKDDEYYKANLTIKRQLWEP